MRVGSTVRRESGSRWEIRRGYINADHADKVARQAHWLMGQTAYCLSVQNHNKLRNGTLGLRSATLHREGSSRNRGLPTLDRYPEIERSVRSITNLYDRTSLETRDTAKVFSILQYASIARLGWHRDEPNKDVADDTVAITLEGCGIIVLRDDTYGRVAFVVNKGDALYLDNSGMPEERVVHMAYNLSRTPRTVFVD